MFTLSYFATLGKCALAPLHWQVRGAAEAGQQPLLDPVGQSVIGGAEFNQNIVSRSHRARLAVASHMARQFRHTQEVEQSRALSTAIQAAAVEVS